MQINFSFSQTTAVFKHLSVQGMCGAVPDMLQGFSAHRGGTWMKFYHWAGIMFLYLFLKTQNIFKAKKSHSIQKKSQLTEFKI